MQNYIGEEVKHYSVNLIKNMSLRLVPRFDLQTTTNSI